MEGKAVMTAPDTPSREEISAIIADWFPGKQFLRDGCADAILARLAAMPADDGVDKCPQCGINRNSPFPCEHDGVREECAKLADKAADLEDAKFNAAQKDSILSDNGRLSILDRALARKYMAQQLALSIRALSTPLPSGEPPSDPNAESRKVGESFGQAVTDAGIGRG